jgi:hypothetical protein
MAPSRAWNPTLVTDNDTGDPMEAATVSILGLGVEGETDAEGKVTLIFTPRRKP